MPEGNLLIQQQLVGSRLKCVINNDPVANPGKGNENVLARLWEELRDEQLVVQEAAQSIFIGNESLLSNLTFLLYYMIQNPECIKKLRAELDTLDHGIYGHQVWRDPKVMRLSYLVSLSQLLLSTCCETTEVYDNHPAGRTLQRILTSQLAWLASPAKTDS